MVNCNVIVVFVFSLRYRATLGDGTNIVQTLHMTEDVTSPTQRAPAHSKTEDHSFSDYSSMTSGSDVAAKDFDWPEVVRSSSKARRVFLPQASRHFAWFLLACITVAGSTLTILYGFQ